MTKKTAADVRDEIFSLIKLWEREKISTLDLVFIFEGVRSYILASVEDDDVFEEFLERGTSQEHKQLFIKTTRETRKNFKKLYSKKSS